MESADKYRLNINDFKEFILDGQKVVLFRIVAVKSFMNKATGIEVKAGERGGYISPYALSQKGSCWVDENSLVVSLSLGSKVTDDAFVSNSKLVGKAFVCDSAKVHGTTIFSDNTAEISGEALVNKSMLSGDVYVSERATIDKSTLNGKVKVKGNTIMLDCVVKNTKSDFIEINLSGKEPCNYSVCGQKIEESLIRNIFTPKINRKRKYFWKNKINEKNA